MTLFRLALAATALAYSVAFVHGQDSGNRPPASEPTVRTVELNIGETQDVQLADSTQVKIKLVDLNETRDPLRDAIRESHVTIEIDGQRVELESATYHLPIKAGGVQVDCPVTRRYTLNARNGTITGGTLNAWGLRKDARFRLWPAGSPWMPPGSFQYPLRQRWFASDSHMSNEPTFVNGDERIGGQQIYYHYGLDFGGAEGLVEVIAATNGFPNWKFPMMCGENLRGVMLTGFIVLGVANAAAQAQERPSSTAGDSSPLLAGSAARRLLDWTGSAGACFAIAADRRNDRLHLVIGDRGVLYHSGSSDGGTRWTAPRELIRGDCPDTAVDRQGTVHIVYKSNEHDGRVEHRAITNEELGPSADVSASVGDRPANYYAPRIAVDGGGNVHVIYWSTPREGEKRDGWRLGYPRLIQYRGETRVVYLQSEDGQSWTLWERILSRP